MYADLVAASPPNRRIARAAFSYLGRPRKRHDAEEKTPIIDVHALLRRRVLRRGAGALS